MPGKNIRLPDPPLSLRERDPELFSYLTNLINQLELAIEETPPVPSGWTVTNLPTGLVSLKNVDATVSTASSVAQQFAILVNDMLNTGFVKGN